MKLMSNCISRLFGLQKNEKEKRSLENVHNPDLEWNISQWERSMINNALYKIKGIKDEKEKLDNIDFLIKVLLNDLQADSYTYYIKKVLDIDVDTASKTGVRSLLFWKDKNDKIDTQFQIYINSFFPRTVYNEMNEAISIEKGENDSELLSLSNITTVVFPERTSSVKGNAEYFKKNKFKTYYCEDSKSFHLIPFNICLVYDKPHSVASALLEHIPTVVNTVDVNLDLALGHVQYYRWKNTWMNAHTGEKLCNCSDYRMGLIWILYGMKKGFDNEYVHENVSV